METHNQNNSPSVELPNDENKLFDEVDDVGNSTIPDLSLPSEVDEEEYTINNVWEYAINDIFQLSMSHVEGKSLRSWVHSQQMESMEQFYEWEEHDIVVGTTQTSYKGNSWDNHTEFLKYNSIKNLHMLSPVQHMPKKMIYLLLKDGVGSEALPRRIKSLQEQSSKVRSDKSGDPKHTCLGTSSPETTWRPCNLSLKTKIVNGMMPLR